MDEETLLDVIDFGNRSLRDLADQDYIAARFAYQAELDQQFLWCGLQAVEKYLKAILLFNLVGSKNLGHALPPALDRVRQIEDLEFDLPSQLDEFVAYLSDYGTNRYLSFPSVLRTGALFNLDATVWHCRRYCQYMRGKARGTEETLVDLLAHRLARLQAPIYKTHPTRFRLSRGYLEKVIDGGPAKHRAYEFLVWKNFYYGRRQKRILQRFTDRSSFVNPAHALNPAAFLVLDKLVRFPSDVRRYYNERAHQNQPLTNAEGARS